MKIIRCGGGLALKFYYANNIEFTILLCDPNKT